MSLFQKKDTPKKKSVITVTFALASKTTAQWFENDREVQKILTKFGEVVTSGAGFGRRDIVIELKESLADDELKGLKDRLVRLINDPSITVLRNYDY